MEKGDNMNNINEYPRGAQIKVIGVGGGGTNMVNHMIREGISGIDMIVANTDAQSLESSLANKKIQLGVKKTKGLGAGMKPEVGAKAAEESFDELKNALDGADMVFIASGMGGGTGTGASPVVAKAAKEVGALTICIVTRPFFFEGRKRDKLALAGIEELKVVSDTMVVIQNDKLLEIVDKNLGYKDSFRLVDNVLAQAVGGMSSVVLSCNESDINADFADVETIMSHKGLAILSIGEAVGEDAAVEAVKNAIESPLLDNQTIDGAMGVLIHFNINPSFPLAQIQNAMQIIYDKADEDADIIFSTTSSDKLAENEVKLTIVATGFDDQKSKKTNRVINNQIETKIEVRPENPTPPPAPKAEPEPTTTTASVGTTTSDRFAQLAQAYSTAKKEKYVLENSNDLDIPTFLRRKMD